MEYLDFLLLKRLKPSYQTIFHAHIHLIPRRKGDLDNPIGGVRNVIFGKGKY